LEADFPAGFDRAERVEMGGRYAAFCDANIMPIGGGLASVVDSQNDAKSSGIYRRFWDLFHTDCERIGEKDQRPDFG
jgi:hypothetical protein